MWEEVEFNPYAIIVDGSYYLHRCWHAVPPMHSLDGFPTNSIYGATRAILRLIQTYTPKHMAVVVDRPEPTFRHRLSPLYKAHRPEYPEAFSVQIPKLIELLEAMGITVVSIPGFEGDDKIGTLAKMCESAGDQVIISTGDKDITQLVAGNISLVDQFKNTRYDRELVYNKFNVYPENVAGLLALAGDAADGIKGLEGVGPKTAAGLIGQYGSIENILSNSDQIKGIIGQKVRDNLEGIALDYKLTTIVTDLDLSLTIDDLLLRPADTDRLDRIYNELSFNSLMF